MIVAYRDSVANAAVLRSETDGTLGSFHNNELQAVGNGDGTITISNRSRSGLSTSPGFLVAASVAFGDFRDQSEVALGATEADTVNALNAIFQAAGSTGNAPVITSALTVNVTQGDTINYELIATDGVGYEWSGLPAGLVTVEGNQRKLVGGSALVAGTYTVTATAVNYFGQDVQNIDFIVAAPPYSNTKSVNFNNNDYLSASVAGTLNGILGRAANGTGAADAWSVSMWLKPGTASNQNQTLAYFGAQDVANSGQWQFKLDGTANSLILRYGTNNNRIEVATPNSVVTDGQWHHILLVYDGGTTGAASGSLSAYYGRFSIYVDGVNQTLTGSHQNFGFTGSVSAGNFRVGRWNNGQSLRNDTRVDELAVWGSDQSSNVAAIYNGGATHNLALLTTPPAHWWRMGDGDTFPTIQDNVGSVDLTMNNMSAADIVTDAP